MLSCVTRDVHFHAPPPQWGGLDLDSRSSGCARLGGEVGPRLGVVVEEVAVLVVLVRRHRHAVRAAVRRAVDDEIPGAIKEETGRFQYACAARACSIDTLPRGVDRYTPMDFSLTVDVCLRGVFAWHADVLC